MRILDRLLPWRATKLSGKQSVQYEMQHMTYKGGWKAHDPEIHIASPEPRPTDDDNWWIYEPGRYRHITRVNGRIDKVLWTYETQDAQDYYEHQREQERIETIRARQRNQLAEMDFEEVRAEFYGDTNQLDKLEFLEIADRYETLWEHHAIEFSQDERNAEHRRIYQRRFEDIQQDH